MSHGAAIINIPKEERGILFVAPSLQELLKKWIQSSHEFASPSKVATNIFIAISSCSTPSSSHTFKNWSI
jgi:hypothetical protein